MLTKKKESPSNQKLQMQLYPSPPRRLRPRNGITPEMHSSTSAVTDLAIINVKNKDVVRKSEGEARFGTINTYQYRCDIFRYLKVLCEQ
mmetsp:Transcript_14256/g.24376  ORF Transcript_14256/g.24376 Transcript_14256/m.24376 type:complete len:89 (+) Transcript_14256:1545-1811(+)